MLDSDLANIYGVTTARLNQQVNRNQERFPEDFMFQLTKEEYESLMLQFATSKKGRGGRRKLPYVFTEHGAIVGQNARLDSALIDYEKRKPYIRTQVNQDWFDSE